MCLLVFLFIRPQTPYNFLYLRSVDTSNFVLKHIMTSLSDPPCLIEHELYVENAVWILHTLFTRECSSNERVPPSGEGGGGGGGYSDIFIHT